MEILQLLDLGFSIAKRAGRMLPDGKRIEFCLEGMVNQKLTDQRLPLPQDKFNGLRCLNQSNLPGHNSQDACFVSAGDQTWRRRFRKKTPQAGPSFFWKEDTGLALELKNASVDIGLSCEKSGIIHQIFGWKVVRSIDDDVVAGKNLECIFRRQSFWIGDDLDIRVDSMDGLFRRFGLQPSHIGRTM
jgi:hypothetical protein